jgi:hypothetical protein
MNEFAKIVSNFRKASKSLPVDFLTTRQFNILHPQFTCIQEDLIKVARNCKTHGTIPLTSQILDFSQEEDSDHERK